MNKEIDMKHYNVRTDLVVDLFDLDSDHSNIKISKDQVENIDITDIDILDEENSLNKK